MGSVGQMAVRHTRWSSHFYLSVDSKTLVVPNWNSSYFDIAQRQFDLLYQSPLKTDQKLMDVKQYQSSMNLVGHPVVALVMIV